MPGLLSLWSFLNARFLPFRQQFSIRGLEFELALKRYYVINTIQTNRKEEAVNFFKEYCAELNISSGNNDTNESSSFLHQPVAIIIIQLGTLKCPQRL